MKKYILISLLTIFSSIAMAAAKPSYLLVLHAKHAIITQQGNAYQLQLDKPVVSAFSDRPYRQAFRLSMDSLLQVWYQKTEDSLSKDHPNAVLVGGIDFINAGKDDNMFIKLSKPQYDKSHDRLSFTIKPLNAQYHITTGQFQMPVLFIDNMGMPGEGCAARGDC